jgi:plastocyanin
MKSISIRVLLLLVTTVILGSGTVDAQVKVAMTQDLRFDPQEVSINVGDTVLWTNTATTHPHTATADSFRQRRQGFNSGSFPRQWLEPGETFQFTFTSAGTYPYHCVPHEAAGMVGTVIVDPALASASKHFFTAAADGKDVVVRWSVPEGERIGFKVLRGTAWDKEFVEVSSGVIKADARTADGEQFSFVDTKGVRGEKYWYILEEVRFDGRQAFRGPAIADSAL